MLNTRPSHEDVRDAVRQRYAAVARTGQLSDERASVEAPDGAGCGCSADGCCTSGQAAAAHYAAKIGYDRTELDALPEGANLGLSCGNPTALASLGPGEVVLDLGSGGGFDCFIAGPRVGATGHVIGVDMTPEMISRARRNLPAYRERSGFDNVEFRLGEIENLPVADASVDVVISNCVLNLSPDKPRVWREIARVLRPGGRVAISDLALLTPLPDRIKGDLEALVGCIAGAPQVEQTREWMRAAGFREITLTPRPGYIDALLDAHAELLRRVQANLPAGSTIRDYVASLDIAGSVATAAN
jgi:SAM-dependent methyltransferase